MNMTMTVRLKPSSPILENTTRVTFLRLRTHHAQTQYLQGFERIEVNVDIL